MAMTPIFDYLNGRKVCIGYSVWEGRESLNDGTGWMQRETLWTKHAHNHGDFPTQLETRKQSYKICGCGRSIHESRRERCSRCATLNRQLGRSS